MKLLIAGYYGYGNLGDELILSSILRDLREQPPVTAICVLSQDPQKTSRLHGVRAVFRWNPWRVFQALWRSDVLVLGGGGLFQNQTSQSSLLYYASLIAMARLVRIPILLYALGIETIRGRLWKPLMRFLLLHKSVRLTVRDVKSKNWLVSAGLSEASITVTADPVFSRPLPDEEISPFRSPAQTALLIPRYPCPAGGQALFQKISTLLRREVGMNVRWMLFQPSLEIHPLGDFMENVISPRKETFASETALQEFSQVVGQFDWVISSRFHGLVLAACGRRPFIGVGDPEKVGRLSLAWGMPYLGWQATEDEIWRAIGILRKITPESMEAAYQQSRQAATATASLVSLEMMGVS